MSWQLLEPILIVIAIVVMVVLLFGVAFILRGVKELIETASERLDTERLLNILEGIRLEIHRPGPGEKLNVAALEVLIERGRQILTRRD